MARNEWLGGAAEWGQVGRRRLGGLQNVVPLLGDALVLDPPFAHLAEVQQLVVLVFGPAHVEDVRMYLTGKECAHVLARFLIELVPPGKLFHIPAQHFGAHPVQAHVFLQ